MLSGGWKICEITRKRSTRLKSHLPPAFGCWCEPVPPPHPASGFKSLCACSWHGWLPLSSLFRKDGCGGRWQWGCSLYVDRPEHARLNWSSNTWCRKSAEVHECLACEMLWDRNQVLVPPPGCSPDILLTLRGEKSPKESVARSTTLHCHAMSLPRTAGISQVAA